VYSSREVFSRQRCPACGQEDLRQYVVVYRERVFEDELLIFTTICDSCNYKKNDVMPVKPSSLVKAKKYVLAIESQEDLYSKVYRAPTASIEIPELEISMEPGFKADLFITNIERILLKFREICEFMQGDEEDEATRELLQVKMQAIDEYLAGTQGFTFILEDEDGFSYVLPAREESLTLEKLKDARPE
jgi:zinc finger protein